MRFKHKLSDRATAGHWQGLPSRAKTCQDLHRWLRQVNLRCGQGESSSRAGQERAWSEREGATVRHTCLAGRRAARRRSPEEPRRERGTQRGSARKGEAHCVCMHPQFFSKNALRLHVFLSISLGLFHDSQIDARFGPSFYLFRVLFAIRVRSVANRQVSRLFRDPK